MRGHRTCQHEEALDEVRDALGKLLGPNAKLVTVLIR